MIFGYVAPGSGVFTIMPIVPHSPIIVHFKCIRVGFYPVDKNLIVLDFQLILFVDSNDPLIQGGFQGLEQW